MAKKVVVTEDELQENDGNVADNGNENSTPVEKIIVSSTSVKKVKVHAIEHIDCIVAGNVYKVGKDKEMEIPADVAAILVNSRKAYRL